MEYSEPRDNSALGAAAAAGGPKSAFSAGRTSALLRWELRGKPCWLNGAKQRASGGGQKRGIWRVCFEMVPTCVR